MHSVVTVDIRYFFKFSVLIESERKRTAVSITSFINTRIVNTLINAGYIFADRIALKVDKTLLAVVLTRNTVFCAQNAISA